MNEVKKISLAGVAFSLDTDAYETLSAYIASLKATYTGTEGEEIVSDIEARIAELILSVSTNDRVVERPLIDNIIAQLGSADDISASDTEEHAAPQGQPRIPRRLYRDMESAKLGGVCSGIGKYFGIDGTWVRLMLFLPLVLGICFHGGIFPYFLGNIFMNIFGVLILSYFVMWFAVPKAETARQKLEMNGEKITIQSIKEQSVASSSDTDSTAKPVVARTITTLGRITLFLLKVFAALLMVCLVLGSVAMIVCIVLFFVGILPTGGAFTGAMVWLPVLGITVGLIPAIALSYILFSLIVSRHPSGKAMLAMLILWIITLAALITVAITNSAENGDALRSTIRNATIWVDDRQMTIGEFEDYVDDCDDDENHSFNISLTRPDGSPVEQGDTISGNAVTGATITATDGENAGVTIKATTDDNKKAAVRVSVKKSLPAIKDTVTGKPVMAQ